ncbi:MAG: ROK family protein [Caldithrix sp.]|nr:ROK family protein [Caldithrix sp.]
MNNQKEYVLGVDIGGTNTVFGLVNRNGHVKEEITITTDAQKGAEQLFSRITDRIHSVLNNGITTSSIKAVGMGAPNANYFKNTIENAPNLGWKFVDVKKIFGQYLAKPLFITNDANASALGEMHFGAAKGMKNVIVITLGTGLGSGIIVDGDLVYGHDGFAGELGHVCVIPNGRQCKCGLNGCLETYVSASGLKRTVHELLAKNIGESILRHNSIEDLEAVHIAEAAEKGDAIAQEAFEFTGKMLGISLASFIAFSRPQAIILFGGLARAGQLLFEPTIRHMNNHVLPLFRDKIDVIPSGLHNGNSAVLGAAALAWHGLERS